MTKPRDFHAQTYALWISIVLCFMRESDEALASSDTNAVNPMQQMLQWFRLRDGNPGKPSLFSLTIDGYSHPVSGEELRHNYATVQAKQRLFQPTLEPEGVAGRGEAEGAV